MQTLNTKLSIRSVPPEVRAKLAALKVYTRLPYGALIQDSVECLWEAYVEDGHALPEPIEG